jgi:hypothetical protein
MSECVLTGVCACACVCVCEEGGGGIIYSFLVILEACMQF